MVFYDWKLAIGAIVITLILLLLLLLLFIVKHSTNYHLLNSKPN